MNAYVRVTLILILVSLMSACVPSSYDTRPVGHPNYGGFYPGAQGPEPGDHVLRAATSLQRVQEFASCGGEGHEETRSTSRTSERDFRYGGYEVRVEQRGSCTKVNGQVLPPRGFRRNGPSSPMGQPMGHQ